MHITEHEIEFSPLSIKGKKALHILKEDIKKNLPDFNVNDLDTESYFFKNFYIEPFTRYNGNNMAYDKLFDDDLVDDEYNHLKNELEILENNILNNSMRLVWIYGTPGCGKTTYIHNFCERHQNDIIVDFCDLEEVKRRITIRVKDKIFRIENEELEDNNCYRFAIRLINQILSVLKLHTIHKSDDINYLRNISVLYKEKIYNEDVDSNDVIKFFEIIDKINFINIEKSIEELVAFFIEIISTTNFKSDRVKKKALVGLTDISLHVMLCSGYLEKKKRICVFDNIEYCISIKQSEEIDNIIQDNEIENILNSLQDSIAGLMWEFLSFQYIPSFVVVTRYATVAFNRNTEMDAYHSCDVTKWFCPKEIYDKKINFLMPLINTGERDKKLVYKAFKFIMNDCTRSKWSLASLLSKFFNYNSRCGYCRCISSPCFYI